MKNQSVIVIHEKDLDDGEDIVIGVASDLASAEKLIDEYYGEHTVESFNDIRDCNLEYSKVISVEGTNEFEVWRSKITLEWFNIDIL